MVGNKSSSDNEPEPKDIPVKKSECKGSLPSNEAVPARGAWAQCVMGGELDDQDPAPDEVPSRAMSLARDPVMLPAPLVTPHK
jgi:hypothetical protein